MNLSKQQLAEQISAAESYLQSLRTMADAIEPEAVKEWPQNGDTVWLATTDLWSGEQLTKSRTFHGDQCDASMLSMGFFHRTEALARRRVEALKVAAELRRMPGRCDAGIGAYAIRASYFGCRHCMVIDGGLSVANSAIAGVWFMTEDAAQHALDTIGQDRLAVYLADFLDEPMGDE